MNFARGAIFLLVVLVATAQAGKPYSFFTCQNLAGTWVGNGPNFGNTAIDEARDKSSGLFHMYIKPDCSVDFRGGQPLDTSSNCGRCIVSNVGVDTYEPHYPLFAFPVPPNGPFDGIYCSSNGPGTVYCNFQIIPSLDPSVDQSAREGWILNMRHVAKGKYLHPPCFCPSDLVETATGTGDALVRSLHLNYTAPKATKFSNKVCKEIAGDYVSPYYGYFMDQPFRRVGMSTPSINPDCTGTNLDVNCVQAIKHFEPEVAHEEVYRRCTFKFESGGRFGELYYSFSVLTPDPTEGFMEGPAKLQCWKDGKNYNCESYKEGATGYQYNDPLFPFTPRYKKTPPPSYKGYDNGYDNSYNSYDNGYGYDNSYNSYDNGYGYENSYNSYDNGYGYDNSYNSYDNGYGYGKGY